MSRILFLVAHPVEDASRRYRVQQFIPLLESAGHECTISEFSTPQLFQALHFKGRVSTKALHAVYCSIRRFARLAALSRFDLIVIHREVFPFFTPLFETLVLKRHTKVIFSMDDAIFAGHPDGSELSHPRLYRFKYGRGVDQVIRASLHVIAGNKSLAEYAMRFNPRVTEIPTVVDCEHFRYKSVGRDEAMRPLTVGWMGSSSTVSYLYDIAGVLKRLADAHPNRVQFRFFGCPDLRLNLPRAEYLPFRLSSELTDLHSIDIGLMPMPDTVWTRGKCAFKAIQYMATGIPTVASPVGTALELIQHDQNGFLAAGAEEWYRALERLLLDIGTRQRLSAAGRRTIEKSYSLQVWGPKMVALFDQLLKKPLSVSNYAGLEPTPPSRTFV